MDKIITLDKMKNSLKTRIEESANYKAIWCDGKTLRFAIDPSKPITELKYPEFYDIKITGNCDGGCSYCYMDSKSENHYDNIIGKTRDFFNAMPKEKLPFQVAIGGGEPTSHPDFIELLRVLKKEFEKKNLMEQRQSSYFYQIDHIAIAKSSKVGTAL
jgi:sulfatase maturation enzyme AslB (radical SAM superfamily)